MKPEGEGGLPPEFFKRLPEVDARIAGNVRQVPRWRWCWSLYGIAFALAVCATCVSLLADRFALAANGLMVAAGLCTLGAVAFHQLPVLRVWIGVGQ